MSSHAPKGGVPVYRPWTAFEGVTAAFTTRHGGCSEGPYASLNLGLHVGDDRCRVLENRARLAAGLGYDPTRAVCGAQVHGAQVVVVDETHAGCGSLAVEQALSGVDGLVTAVHGLPLVAFFADCVPVFLYDPVQRVIGLIHAGWRGTAARIVQEGVSVMTTACGCRAENLAAFIGPSIGPCCYRVRETTAAAFIEETPAVLHPVDKDTWQLNLWEANRRQLLRMGVAASSIKVAGLCTACRNETFFSYRAANGVTGRMAGVMMLRG